MTDVVQVISGRQTEISPMGAVAGTQTASAIYPTIADLVADTALVSGDIVGTLGYYTPGDLGAGLYVIQTSTEFGKTPNEWSDRTLLNGLIAALQVPNGFVQAECWGVGPGIESGARWQEAFWTAADMAGTIGIQKGVEFRCMSPVLTKQTLYFSARDLSACYNVNFWQKGTITANTGGTLAASTYTTSLPIIMLKAGHCEGHFGMIDCNRICSGVVMQGCNAGLFHKPNIVRFQKFGWLNPGVPIGQSGKGQNSNSIVYDAVIKQWLGSDPEFADDSNFTGDCVVIGHYDCQMVGGQIGWAKRALLLLDATPTDTLLQVEGQNIYQGYKSQGCSDFYWERPHLMQGRPDDGGPPRQDNLTNGGPILIECWNDTAKCFILAADLDSGTIQLYHHKIVIEPGASLITGGKNLSTDRINLFHPLVRIYADGSAAPYGLEIEQNNNLTVGFLPYSTFTWSGDYTQVNYNGRAMSPGYTGPVQNKGTWNSATGAFPSGSTAGDQWIVVGSATVGGHVFTEGSVITALKSGSSTSTYAGEWYEAPDGDVDQLKRGVQVRLNQGIQYIRQSTPDIPMWEMYGADTTRFFKTWVGTNGATWDYDGTILELGANTIRFNGWDFINGSPLQPVNDLGKNIGSTSKHVQNIYAAQFFPGATSGPLITAGTGTPEGAVAAPVGSLFLRIDGGAGTSLYVKQTGSGNTGWVGK